MKQKKLLIIVLVFILLMAGAYALYHNLDKIVDTSQLTAQTAETVQKNPQKEPETEQEKQNETEQNRIKVPDVPLTDWEGNTVQLSDYFGKPLVLNFWASWCGPCKSEMPNFQKVYEELGEEVQFLMVNLTGGRETLKSAKDFINKGGYTFPVFFDLSQAAAYTYSTYSIPISFFIDADGNLVTYASGALSEELLRKGIGMITEAE